MDNEIVCITAPDDPLANTGPVAAGALRQRAWLLREQGSGTRALNLEFLAARGVRPATLTLGSNGAIKQAARAGLGVSLISRTAAELELSAGLLSELELVDPPPPRPWFVLRSAVGPVREVAKAFVAFAQSHRGMSM
jgi:LysR family transcriptional regulator, low CO2-responsive transcriptional regulator